MAGYIGGKAVNLSTSGADIGGTTNLDAVDIDGAVNMATTALVTGVLTTTAATVHTNGITMPDNAKAIFGAGSDLQIYHDGTNSHIREAGAGQLYIRAYDGINLQTTAAENYFTGTADGAVTLYYDNAAKLATTSTGVDITGGFTATNDSTITIDDNGIALELISTDTDASSGPVLSLYRNSASPADGDDAGKLQFNAENDADEKILYADILCELTDVSDGTEDGRLALRTKTAGSMVRRLQITDTELVINEDSIDSDFRIESDTDTQAFFVEGSTGNIGMSTSNPDSHTPQTHNPDKRSFVSYFAGGTQFVAGRSDTAVVAGDYIGGYLFKTNDGGVNRFGGMIATADDGSGNGNLEFFPVSGHYETSTTSEGQMQLDDTGDLFLRAGGIRIGRSHADVYGSVEEAIVLYHTGSGSNDTATDIRVRDGTGGDYVFRHLYRNTVKSEIEENGDFQSATSSYGGVSDERLKENISPASSQWDDIKALQFKNYSMIDAELDAPNMLGVIAQDLQAAGMNGLVKQNFKTNADDEPVLDADGNQEEYLSVKYSVLYMKAVKALQEAMAKIETLEARVTALEEV